MYVSVCERVCVCVCEKYVCECEFVCENMCECVNMYVCKSERA